MTLPITLKVNTSIAKLSQNVVDLLDSIKSTYVVKHVKENKVGQFGFRFGVLNNCEHSIQINSNELKAEIKLLISNNEYISLLLGKSKKDILQDMNFISEKNGYDGIIHYWSTFQDALDSQFGKGLVRMQSLMGTHNNLIIYIIVDITELSTDAISAISELLQHTDLKLSIIPSRHYSI